MAVDCDRPKLPQEQMSGQRSAECTVRAGVDVPAGDRMPPTFMPISAGTRFGPYEIVSLIGAGGMGEVYEARDVRLNRMVALKVLPADLVTNKERKHRFTQEAQ